MRAHADPAYRSQVQGWEGRIRRQLARAGEAIGLFAPNGSLVDSVTFGAQMNDVSQGRWPDANSGLYFMVTPTPRAACTS